MSRLGCNQRAAVALSAKLLTAAKVKLSSAASAVPRNSAAKLTAQRIGKILGERLGVKIEIDRFLATPSRWKTGSGTEYRQNKVQFESRNWLNLMDARSRCARWMWGDLIAVARYDPLRWSSLQPIALVLAELLSYSTTIEQSRPVLLEVPSQPTTTTASSTVQMQ